MQLFKGTEMGVMKERFSIVLALLLGILFATVLPCYSQVQKTDSVLDEKVNAFLSKMKNRWRDWNVPEKDGRILYDIIMQNQYKRALEVGTSTGHSAIWIAWALSKTGGKLITIEIDEDRCRQALANFKEAGLSAHIDARNADAHQLVEELSGPFDFVFIDADKEWYINYAKALIPKIEQGGCIAAHNVEERAQTSRATYVSDADRYFQYMKDHPDFETRVHPGSRTGIAMSYKKRIR
jgi:predicted O-methyltransferase YrrM